MKLNLLGLEIDIDRELFGNYLVSPDARRKKTPVNTKPVSYDHPPVVKRTLDFERTWGRGSFLRPEWDLNEIGRLETVDSYVARSVKIKTSLGTKEGYELVGRDNRTVEYINNCYNQIAIGTGIPIQQTIWRVFADLILYSNAYLVKARDSKAALGRSYKLAGRNTKIEPVAGYFPVHPACMEISKSDSRIIKYRQTLPNGRHKEFAPEDVVHFYYDKPPGFLVGKPTIVPVIEDIRLLRSLEENVALLVHKHLFPLYHYIVGTDQYPAGIDQDGVREVERIQQTLEELPADGVIISDHRHKVVAVGAESKAIRAEGYMEAAKKRALAGLAISTLDMGEGDTANRNTSDNLSNSLVNHVKDFQYTLQWQWDLFINTELLLQAPLANKINPLDKKHMVYLRFNEIDKDSMIKMQTHIAQLWGQDLLTWAESRDGLNREPLTEQQKLDTRFYQIKLTELEAQVEAAQKATEVEVGPTGHKKSTITKKGTGTTAEPAKKSGANVIRPTNQHGTNTGPEKRKSSIKPHTFMSFDNTITYNRDKLSEQIYNFVRDNGGLAVDNEKNLCYNSNTIEQITSYICQRLDHLILNGIKCRQTYQTVIQSILNAY